MAPPIPPVRSAEQSLAAAKLWPFLIAALALVAALLLAFPISHLFSPVSFNYSEGWNAYWDEAVRLGRPLYGAAPDWTIANYPPISFHLTALFSRLSGQNVTVAGRVVALACLLWSAANVGVAARSVTSSAGAGWLAACSLLLWVALVTPTRLGTNDPHFLALALSTLGLCAFLRAVLRATDRLVWIAVAACLFATALFVKNAMLGLPLAAAVILVDQRRWRALALFAAAGAITAAFWAALSFAVDGRFFLVHLLSPRALDRANGISSLLRAVNFLYAPLLLAAAGLVWAVGPRKRLLAPCLLVSLAVAVALVFGDGVADNIYYEMLAALAVTTAFIVDMVRRQAATAPRGWVPAIAVALLIVAPSLAKMPDTLHVDRVDAHELAQRTADWAAGVALLRATPGPVLCESLLMCFEADKPFVADPYYLKDQVIVGRVAEADVVAALRAHRFAAVEIGEDDTVFTLTAGARLRFTAATMDALLTSYRVVLRTPTFAIFVPL